MSKIERLKKEDNKELLQFLNEAFGYSEKDGFSVQMPVMWRENDEVMGKNLAIKENGKIIAAAGVYPLKLNIAGQSLLFATTGNIAVKKEYRGKAYMKELMTAIGEEVNNLGIDVARLGGQRQRYNRYGYEYAGKSYNFTLTYKNLSAIGVIDNEELNKIEFKRLTKESIVELTSLKQIQESSEMYVNRGNETDFFDIMSAWRNIPYCVFDENGNCIGGLSASQDNRQIAEVFANNDYNLINILYSWIIKNSLDYSVFNIPCYKKEVIRRLSSICEYINVGFSTQIRVLNFEKFTDALISLKGKTESEFVKVQGSFVLNIKGYGNIKISASGCVKTEEKADLIVDSLVATRLLYGFQSPEDIVELPSEKRQIIKSILPLSFWWNGQDRV